MPTCVGPVACGFSALPGQHVEVKGALSVYSGNFRGEPRSPNIQAHLPGRLESQYTLENQNAGPVRCSVWFGGTRFTVHESYWCSDRTGIARSRLSRDPPPKSHRDSTDILGLSADHSSVQGTR